MAPAPRMDRVSEQAMSDCYTCDLLRRVGPCFGHGIADLVQASMAEDTRNWAHDGPCQIRALLDLMRAVRTLTSDAN